MRQSPRRKPPHISVGPPGEDPDRQRRHHDRSRPRSAFDRFGESGLFIRLVDHAGGTRNFAGRVSRSRCNYILVANVARGTGRCSARRGLQRTTRSRRVATVTAEPRASRARRCYPGPPSVTRCEPPALNALCPPEKRLAACVVVWTHVPFLAVHAGGDGRRNGPDQRRRRNAPF